MKSGNLTPAISDHLPSFLVIPKANQNHAPKKQTLYTRKTKNFDRVNFVLDYLDIDWNTILKANKNNVNTSLQIFLAKINALLDKYMPLKKVLKRDYMRRFKPWINDIILEKINKKNKAFKQYMNCKDPLIKEQLKTEFKALKNEITTLTRQSKNDYYNQYFTTSTKNLERYQGNNKH